MNNIINKIKKDLSSIYGKYLFLYSSDDTKILIEEETVKYFDNNYNYKIQSSIDDNGITVHNLDNLLLKIRRDKINKILDRINKK